MSKAQKPTTKRVSEKPLARDPLPAYSAPDRALIAACIKAAEAFGGYRHAFKADPGGNIAQSGPVGDAAFARMVQWLEKAALMPAQTMSGLSSKARVAPMVLEVCEGTFDQFAEDFLASLAADAKRLADVIVDQQWLAVREKERGAAKGGAA